MRQLLTLFTALLLLSLGAACSLCRAADQQAPENWAASSISVKELDFGTTVRGLEPIKKIRITNRWKEPLHIAGIQASMGPFFIKEAPEQAIKSGESADVVVYLNTFQNQGGKNQVIKIIFDSPAFGMVRLPAKVFIRSDLICETGPDGWGTIRLGKSGKQTARIAHVGDQGWKILGIDSSDPNLDVAIREKSREMSKTDPKSETVEYEATVAVKPSARAGKFEASLTVQLPDKECSSFEIPVKGEIVRVNSPARAK